MADRHLADADRHLADTHAIAFMLKVPDSTVRAWAHRGLLKRRGTGMCGIALYWVEDAEELAAQRQEQRPP